MIKWLGENRELVGIKKYLSTWNKVSFLPNLQGDLCVGLRMLCTVVHIFS
jgi:hypothetical protein